MSNTPKPKYFFISLFCHVAVLTFLILGFDFSTPLAVVENTNKNDVISAVVLGDTVKSKVLPQEIKPTPAPISPQLKSTPVAPLPPVAKEIAKKIVPKEPDKDEIALKIAQKKQEMAEKQLAEKTEKKRQEKLAKELIAKDLLADIQKINDKKKKVVQKKLQSQFEKVLQEQAEKTLRDHLLNEEIKLQSTESRQAQGEINKYKALILQAISERWLIPPQVNKKAYCELMIHIAPSGRVLEVHITKTSGDPALDSSARAAVLKASPLPVPTDTGAFTPFKQFVLKMKPENALGDALSSN